MQVEKILVFGRLLDVFGRLSHVFGRLSDGFRLSWMAFRWWTAFRYRGQLLAIVDSFSPTACTPFFGREAPQTKCMKQKLAHSVPIAVFLIFFLGAKRPKKICMKQKLAHGGQNLFFSPDTLHQKSVLKQTMETTPGGGSGPQDPPPIYPLRGYGYGTVGEFEFAERPIPVSAKRVNRGGSTTPLG